MTAIAAGLGFALSRRDDADLMARLIDRLRGTDSSQGSEEAALVERLRSGDEAAFAELIDRYGASMLRVARMHVRDQAVAEEVVQETWLAVINGIERFEGRSSLRTWLFRILTNRAKTRGEREGRTVPFSSIVAAEAAADSEPAVDADRFLGADHERYGYHWAAPPRPWTQERVLERETLSKIQEAIDALPETQRTVIRLRDVEGWSADEVAEALGITDVNQRVLLHRARSKVRNELEGYMDPELEAA
jgi:RNA polymerase sigma-70 factor (ECF subfamily)